MKIREVNSSDARANLSTLLGELGREHQITYLTVHGKRVGALVSVADAQLLDRLDWDRRTSEVWFGQFAEPDDLL